jgi:hypothetical protein
MRLSTHFGLSSQYELFCPPEGNKTPEQGLTALDLEAQNIISDLFYYALPNTALFTDRTIPELSERTDIAAPTILKIHLKSREKTNIGDDGLVRDIVDTLRSLYNMDSDCDIRFYKPEMPEEMLLCSIEYEMAAFGPAVSKMARHNNQNDEQFHIRADYLVHILERRGDGRGYIPAHRLN